MKTNFCSSWVDIILPCSIPAFISAPSPPCHQKDWTDREESSMTIRFGTFHDQSSSSGQLYDGSALGV